MLPQSAYFVKSNKTIYINPNFKGQLPTTETNVSFNSTSAIPKNAHINPLFLVTQKQIPQIHMNPAFIQKYQENHQEQQEVNKNNVVENKKSNIRAFQDVSTISVSGNSNAADTRKIICKSKNRLIREPLAKNAFQTITTLSPDSLPPLLLLNKRKLIRKTNDTNNENVLKSQKNAVMLKSRVTKYKLDNRAKKKKSLLPPTPRIKRTSFVGRYALRRTSLNTTQHPPNKKSFEKSNNKKLQVLNINGLLYKSTQNSLKLKRMTTGLSDSTVKTSHISLSNQKCLINHSIKSNQGLTIFVRGTKYVMDANKFKLTRVTSTEESLTNANISKKVNACRRIDIGGYTYISVNSAKNTLIRTSNHLSRAYVHNAKQKSLNMLTKRLVKSNVPCPIYQRVGKCAAFERGKCSKVHNKLQVAICSKFLRGECLNTNCLLSHNVSLSKMPVCKFFLQGVCVRNKCQYLHKKLSNKAELCMDFLRGFCKLADKCTKRHEFVCPEIERNGTCTTMTCIYCKSKWQKELQMEKLLESLQNTSQNVHPDCNGVEHTENVSCMRYFKEPCDTNANVKNDQQAINKNFDIKENIEENGENIRKTRPKLGALPAYIPL